MKMTTKKMEHVGRCLVWLLALAVVPVFFGAGERGLVTMPLWGKADPAALVLVSGSGMNDPVGCSGGDWGDGAADVAKNRRIR